MKPALRFNLAREALLALGTARFLPAGDPVTVATVSNDVRQLAPPATAANLEPLPAGRANASRAGRLADPPSCCLWPTSCARLNFREFVGVVKLPFALLADRQVRIIILDW